MSVTEQDWEKATDVVTKFRATSISMTDAIAAAIAAERDNTRAPFQELLEELEHRQHAALRYAEVYAEDGPDKSKARARHAAYKRATDGLRHALQDQP